MDNVGQEGITRFEIVGHYRGRARKCVRVHRATEVFFINGEISKAFQPYSGLRQGDPISPYLFVLCMEKLSQIINCRVSSKDWKGVRASRGGPLISQVFFADDLILFSEASESQAYVLKECMNIFCTISGQKINAEKSAVFVSNNTGHVVAIKIADICDAPLVHDLGSYLGVPLIHSKVYKRTYACILEKIKGRLASWKASKLSTAGRITLIKSVMSSLPVYTMGTVKLPSNLCKDIDKINRKFLWAGSQDQKAMHLINWDQVCQRKNEGGLGIRKTDSMNQAILAKLGWRVNRDKDSLWAKMIKAKYLNNTRDYQVRKKPQPSDSSTWRGINHGLKVVEEGSIRVIGNGRSTLFWKDRWLKRGSLLNLLPNSQAQHELVSDFLIPGGWYVDKLKSILPWNIIKEILVIYGSSTTDIKDTVRWDRTTNEQFSVKTVYSLISEQEVKSTGGWKFIWELKVPPKINCFLWTLGHGKILTNSHRKSRKLTNQAGCNFCNFFEEDLNHVFRDCSAASKIWKSFPFLPPNLLTGSRHFNRWLKSNLKNSILSWGNLPWADVFAFTIWMIWKWRCSSIFNPAFRYPANGFRIIKDQLANWIQATKETDKNDDNAHLCHWKTPPWNVYKINTDGSRGDNGEIAAGGLIRDWNGDWIAGFKNNLGSGEIVDAEAWAILRGLCLARDCGCANIILESDCKETVEVINSNCPSNYSCERPI